MSTEDIYKRLDDSLIPEQQEVLMSLVEIARRVPNHKFELWQTPGTVETYVDLRHPGRGVEDASPYIGHLQALHTAGLITWEPVSRNLTELDITGIGFKYYDHIRQPMHNTTEEQLQRVLAAIAELQGEHPNMRTTDAEIKKKLGMPMEDVHGSMDLLDERGWTDPKDTFGHRGTYLNRLGRIDLKDPSLLPRASTPGIGTDIDQRHQQVNYHYNAAGNINFGAVQNRIDLVGQLEALKTEIRKAGDANAVDGEIVDDAEYHLTKAITQARKPAPDTQTLVDHLNTAKTMLETGTAAAGLVGGITAAIAAIQRLP